MGALEKNVIWILLLFFKYVNNCLTTVATNEVTGLLKAFSKLDKRIQLTCRIEGNHCINFLDLSLIRTQQTNLKQNDMQNSFVRAYISSVIHIPVKSKDK